jgi:hypothetical protein
MPSTNKKTKKTPSPPPQVKKEYIVFEKEDFILLKLHIKTEAMECSDKILTKMLELITQQTEKILSLKEEINLIKLKTIF